MAKVGSLESGSLVAGEWVDGHPEHSLRQAASRGLPLQQVLGGVPAGGKGKITEKLQSQESGGGTLAENCFTAENSTANRQVIANLQKELQAAFSSTNGGGQPDNSIWIDQILLGRLIRERTAIDRAIKSFTKFQHREIMRKLVKLCDLEDMAEPPFHGNMGILQENQRLQGDNEMEVETGDHRGSPSDRYLRPEDIQSVLCPSATL